MRKQMKDSMNELLNGIYEESIEVDYGLREVNEGIEELEDSSLVSDGNHTFGELYYHRMVLFMVICHNNKDLSWKSRMHSDGYELKNSFIVGIETPEGQFTYHYPVEHWKKFKVKILDVAPEFDGHNSNDVLRLLSL